MKYLFIFLLFGQQLIWQQAWTQTEPDAGNWQTWVISSGKAFRLPAPPDKTNTQAEIKEIIQLQAKPQALALDQIQYWNAGAPTYRWQQIVAKLPKGNTTLFRAQALLHVAIYDATVAAWDSKYAYNRARPSKSSGQIKKLLTNPDSPSYPCEYAVTAGAAASILAYLYPQQGDSIQNLAWQAAQSRVLAGVQYPSDVKAGLELGRKVAAQVIERAKKDGSDALWRGTLPEKKELWNGSNPVGAAWGSWKPWLLDSTSQFRPAAPPDFAKDMQELRSFKPTTESNARFYQYAFADIWTEIIEKKIFEYHLDQNPPMAARVYALKSIAIYDAILACWEAKYFYRGIRPYQYDTTFTQVLGRPPHPGYPSGHATTSSAAATVLSYLFPNDKAYFEQVAQECAESRFEGGLHFRTDNEVGLDQGRKVAAYIIAKVKQGDVNKSAKLVKQ
jgi:membrane-associated phospholipid phosphatase